MAGAFFARPLTFSPVPGTYAKSRKSPVSYTITANELVAWNWSATGDLPTSSVVSGGTAGSITFTLSSPGACTVTVTSGDNSWTLNLTATDPFIGGGGP